MSNGKGSADNRVSDRAKYRAELARILNQPDRAKTLPRKASKPDPVTAAASSSAPPSKE